MTFDELYKYYVQQGFTKPISGVAPAEGIQTLIPKAIIPTTGGGGSDSGPTFSVPTKEESEATLTEGMTDVGENKGIGSLGSMAIGALFSAINPFLGMAYSLADPNSMTRQVLSKIGFNPTTEGSIGSTDGPFGGYGGFTGTEGTFSTDTSDTGASQANSGGFDSDAEDSDQSGGDASSTSGTDSAGDGGDGYATGGRVGYNEGTEPTNQLKYIEPNINYTTGSQGPVKTEIFEGIIRGNLPLDDKWKILGDLGIIDNRMKFEDFVDKFKDIQRTLGIGYDSGDGLSGFLKYNFDTKEPQAGIQYKKTFQSGGRVNYLQGGLSSLLGNYYGKR